MQESSIAGLRVLHTPIDKLKPSVILLHGYGASGDDLTGLLPLFSDLDVNFLFPEGFVEIPFAPGYSGHAWFPIDVELYQRAVRTGQDRDLAEMRPAGMDTARDRLMQFLADTGLSASSVFLGGFSQGAMMSLDISLTLPAELAFAGLILLSGTLVDAANTRARLQRPPFPFFQSHGKSDPVLSFRAASMLHTILSEGGHEGELHSFEGGHEIPYEIAMRLRAWLEKLIHG